MKKIRIIQLGLTENYYGTEKVIMNMYRAIDRDKIQFDFLVHHTAPRLPYEEEIEKLGGKVYREYYDFSERHCTDYISPKEFFYKHPEINGIHYNVNKFTPIYRYIEAAKKNNIPIRVIHSHNSGYMYKNSLKDMLYILWVKNTLKYNSTDLIACSSLAGKWNFNKLQYKIVNNSIDIEKYTYNQNIRNSIRAKYSLQDKFVVGFIGRLQYQKNPEFLLKVYKELKKIKCDSALVILGDGELYSTLQVEIQRQNLEDVYLMGHVENVREWLQAFDCFVFPSRFEGLGIALIEAQAAGLKCYTSKDVVPKEVKITENIEFISLDEKPVYWAKCILQGDIKERRDMYKCIQQAGYDLISLGENITKIYEESYNK